MLYLDPLLHPDSNFLDWRPVKNISLVESYVWHENCLRHFAYFSPNFYVGSKSPKFCLDFRPESPLRRCGFEIKRHIGNLRHALGPQMIGLRVFPIHFAPYPEFLQGSKSPKFDVDF